MKAAIFDKFGSAQEVLEIQNIEDPKINDNEVVCSKIF